MNRTFRLTRIFGIDIDIHVTFFFLLLFFALVMGLKGLVLIVGVFFFVTVHELCHSIVALKFGIKVKKITLLPIGGLASMQEMPTKPYQEFIISIAGPLSNIAMLVILYYPVLLFLGKDTMMYPLYIILGRVKEQGPVSMIAYLYWINLVLAAFNMIPAFPMDGGRVLRAMLAQRMGFAKATEIAVRVGHVFALLFAYVGIVHGHILLVLVAVFLYMSASSEGIQVQMKSVLGKYSLEHVLAGELVCVHPDSTLSEVIKLVFHTHVENFPVLDDGKMIGFLTQRDIIEGLHNMGDSARAADVMRSDIRPLPSWVNLDVAQNMMRKYNTNAIPVEKNGAIAGVVSIGDINRVLWMERT